MNEPSRELSANLQEALFFSSFLLCCSGREMLQPFPEYGVSWSPGTCSSPESRICWIDHGSGRAWCLKKGCEFHSVLDCISDNVGYVRVPLHVSMTKEGCLSFYLLALNSLRDMSATWKWRNCFVVAAYVTPAKTVGYPPKIWSSLLLLNRN